MAYAIHQRLGCCQVMHNTEIHSHTVHLFKSIHAELSLPRHTRINTNYQSHTWANLSSSVTFYNGMCLSPVICMMMTPIMKPTAKCNWAFHIRCSSHKAASVTLGTVGHTHMGMADRREQLTVQDQKAGQRHLQGM